MLIEKLSKILFTIFAICLFSLVSTTKVDASYKYCDQKIEGTNYYDCGSYIYTYYEDTSRSSIIYSADKQSSIIYAGEKDGTSVFYANGLKFYNRSYDDTTKANNDMWTVVSTKGKEVFNGSFKDSWLLDDSHEDYYYFILNRDVYAFRQYTNNGELYRTIAIYNVDKNSIAINSVEYDGFDLNDYSQEVLKSEIGISGKVSAKYGAKYVTTSIDGQVLNNTFDGVNIFISSDEVNKYLLAGETQTLEIAAHNYFGGSIIEKYKIKLVSYGVTIHFSTMSSIVESNSRRILINADAGKGKNIDTDYCWYYWSTSGDDSLLYDDFLKNYANSSYKGSYSEDKGVIIRNTTGTYYLYALARDEDSWIVERSEGYILNDVHPETVYYLEDILLIIGLSLLAITPVCIYLIIRKKGY